MTNSIIPITIVGMPLPKSRVRPLYLDVQPVVQLWRNNGCIRYFLTQIGEPSGFSWGRPTNDNKSFVTFLSLIHVFSFALRPQTRTPGMRAGVQFRFFTTHSNVCFVSFCRTFIVNEVLNRLWWKNDTFSQIWRVYSHVRKNISMSCAQSCILI